MPAKKKKTALTLPTPLQALQETDLSESDAKKYAAQFEDYPDLRDEFVKTISRQ